MKFLPGISGWAWLFIFFLAIACLECQYVSAEAETEMRRFDIQEGKAIRTLRKAAKQAQVEFIFSADILRGVTTQSIHGEFKPIEAFNLMLADTSLAVIRHGESGVYAIRSLVALSDANANSELNKKLQMKPNNPKKRKLLSGLAALFVAGTPGYIVGQDDDDSEEIYQLSPFNVIGEKVEGYRAISTISASRVNVPLENVPMNIPVMTSELIEDIAALGHREALRWSPAVNDKNVRGFSTDEFVRNGFLHLSDFSQYDIERMEIVRGPSAVLQGTTTPGGLINVIPKLAIPGTSFTEVKLVTGSRPYMHAAIDVHAGELGQDAEHGNTFAFRFVGAYEHADGLTRFGDRRLTLLVPSFQWRPTDKTSISVDFKRYLVDNDRQDEEHGRLLTIEGSDSFASGKVPLSVSHGIPMEANFIGPDFDAPEKAEDLTIRFEQKLTEEISIEAAFNRHDRELRFNQRIDVGSAIRENPSVANPTPLANPNDFVVTRKIFRRFSPDVVDQFRITALGQYTFGETSHRFVVGAQGFEFTRDRMTWRPFEVDDPSQPYLDIVEISGWNNPEALRIPWENFVLKADSRSLDVKDRSSLLFNHQAEWIPGRFYTLWGVTRAELSINEREDSFDGNGLVQGDIDELSTNLPQVGAVYYFDDDKSFGLFGNYSKSSNPALASRDPQGNPFPPATADIVELGTKFNLLENKFQGTFSLYEIVDSNRIVTDPTVLDSDGNLGAEVQRGEVTSEGFDFDFFYYPTQAWSIIGGYSYNDTYVSDGVANPDSPEEAVGALIEETYKHKFAIWNKYTVQEGPMAGWFFGGGLTWKSKEVIQPDRNGSPAYFEPVTRVDLMAGFDGQWGELPYTVALNVKNLTGEDNLNNNLNEIGTGSKRELQGGFKPNSNQTYTFFGDQDIEVVLSLTFRM